MGSQNELVQIRNAFKIPDGVTVRLAPKLFPSPTSSTGTQQSSFNIDQTVYGDKEIYRSALGTPVYTNIEFLPGTYETKTKGLFRDTPLLIYDAILISVSLSKKIVKTEIQGRDGTVKEYIGMDDYQVTINGIITGKNGQYPIDEVASLKQVLDAPIAIEVASTYLNNLGINSIVIESYDISQQTGSYSYQAFTINAISDIEQEIIFTNV